MINEPNATVPQLYTISISIDLIIECLPFVSAYTSKYQIDADAPTINYVDPTMNWFIQNAPIMWSENITLMFVSHFISDTLLTPNNGPGLPTEYIQIPAIIQLTKKTKVNINAIVGISKILKLSIIYN